MSYRARIILCIVLAGIGTAGCHSIGPQTIPRDRFDYSAAMSESWKRQIMLNIVRLRYMDPPIFMDVGQIVAGYTLETGISSTGQFGQEKLPPGSFAAVNGKATFTDRPTITYTPLTGSAFVRGLMTPIPPESLFFTIESGWAADAILRTGVIAMNGLKNEEYTVAGYQPADPDFLRVCELMRAIQSSGAASLKVVQDKDKRETKVISFRSRGVSEETKRDMIECRKLLGMDPDATEVQLVFGAVATNDHQLAMQTRSLLHIMGAMAARAEVPEEHVRDGRATPGITASGSAATRPVRIVIRCTVTEPKESFVAVQYRGQWFWVDDHDLLAKRDLSFMMMLFTLADTGQKEPLPLITIPAQ